MHADAPLPERVEDAELRWGVQVDAVGFAGEAEGGLLHALLPVLQGFDIATAAQSFDLHLMDIADREIAVQRLADGQGRVAEVAVAQLQVQLVVEANAQFQLDRMGPARQRLFGAVEDELEADAAVLLVDAEQLPIQTAYQAVGRRQAAALVQTLHRLGVAAQVAEPGPAQRHAATYALALVELGLLAEPDQRPLALALVAENLRTLLGDQKFGAGRAHAPAGQLVHIHPLHQRSLLGAVHDCVPYSSDYRKV